MMENKLDRRDNNMCIKYSKEKTASFLKTLNKEFDVFSKINKEDNNINKSFNNNEDLEKIYHYKYTKYMLYEFNCTIVNMLIIYINKINPFSFKYKNEHNFTYNMINLFKNLLMNEIEVAFFTILIDKIGWNYKYIDHWLYFHILGILTKKLCGKGNDFKLLFNMISRNYINFADEYSYFINDEKITSITKDSNIILKQINKRYIRLTKPVNSYCRKNIINYQDIIDKIVKLSQPYFKETNKEKINDNNNYQFQEVLKIRKMSDKNNNIEKKPKEYISNKIPRIEEQISFINKQNDTDSEGYKLYGYGIQNNLNKEELNNNINQNIFNLESIDFLQFDDNFL